MIRPHPTATMAAVGESSETPSAATTSAGVTSVLVVSHSRTGSTARLRDAAVDAIAGVPGVVARALDASDAALDDVLVADAVLFCTPARFGALAGLTKDFLERIYPWFEEVPDVRPGMPWTAIVKGATDPSGAVRDLDRILRGLRWKPVLPPLEVVGDLTDAHLAQAADLAATLAAGTESGIW